MNYDFIPAWANTIAQMEGYNTPGTRPARNHNPGDLKYAGQPGAIGADAGGFAIFPDDVTGFQALYLQLQKYVLDYPGFTILDITAHYLGQSSPTVNSQGNAFTYAAAVASSLGVDTGTTLAQLAGGMPGVAAPASPIPTDSVDASSTGTIDASMFDASGLSVLDTSQFTSGELIAGIAVLALFTYLALR